MHCKICSDSINSFAHATILGRYPIEYFRCPTCGFIHTEEPYWLEEAYSNVIAGSDIGLVRRNLRLAVNTQAIIATWFDSSQCFLDIAGGYGLLVRLMRDAGYDFRWHDKYCQNILAKGFEADISDISCYELVTAFEVFEHLQDPVPEIHMMARYSRNILFSTVIVPENVPKPDLWWYYGLNHGQHISFYTLKSLQKIADTLSLNFYSDGHSLHIFTEKKLSSVIFKLYSIRVIAELFSYINKRQTLLLEDAKRLGCKF